MSASSSERALEGQRRQVTVLFADMADYTPTAERLGEEATYALMRLIIGDMSRSVQAHEGTVQNLTGDGLMALFGAPVAIEDAPLKACRAALAIQERLRDQENAIDAEHGVRPKIRIGIHTGPLVVGKIGDGEKAEITALGDTVNLASRLESEAAPGGILLSEATHRLIDGFASSAFEGERAIKGKSEPQRVYALEGLREEVTRFDLSVKRGLSAMVGRGSELEALRQAWDGTSGGGLQMVDIVGEAGIGKSRLVHEFLESAGRDKLSFLQGRCSSAGTMTPFLPFIEIVQTSFRIADVKNRGDVERRLRRGMEIMGLDAQTHLPYLLNLLGHEVESGLVNALDSEVVGVRTRDALQALLRGRCANSPTILFFDDLHWMDRASEDLLRGIAERDGDLPLLLIRAYRPGYAAPLEGRKGSIEIKLSPLPRHMTDEFLKKRLGIETVPEELARLIDGKAEGNPLFAEEIVNYLLEKGGITRSSDGVACAVSDIDALPVTLENLLMDRFDRLEAGPRAVLEAASAIGARFTAELAGAAVGRDGDVLGDLRRLEEQELILPETGEDAYRFKHALVREAVYDSMLRPARERLHGRIAAAIEDGAGYAEGEYVDILAHHYALTPDTEKAVRYLAASGERSLIVYSLNEAETRFREAIDRIEADPEWNDDAFLIDVLLKQCRVLYFRIEFFQLIDLVERYLPIAERLGDRRRLARLMFEGGYAHVFAAQHDIGKPMLERVLAVGEDLGDLDLIGHASMGLLWHCLSWEPPGAETQEQIQRHFENAYRHGETLKDVWLMSKALAGVAVSNNVMGRPDKGREYALRLMELGRRTNDPRPREMGLWVLAIINAIYFEYEEAIANADEALTIGLSPMDRTLAEAGKGGALTMLGRSDEGERVMAGARLRIWEGGLRLALSALEYPYGLAMLMNGDMARGVRWIEDGMRRFAEWGYVAGGATGNLFLGEIYLEMAIGKEKPPPSVMLRNIWFLMRTLPFAAAKARRHLETAVALSREYDMPAVLAWSLMDLGRLHAAKKRHAESRTCMEEAQVLAQSVDLPIMVERIGGVLAALPAGS